MRPRVERGVTPNVVLDPVPGAKTFVDALNMSPGALSRSALRKLQNYINENPNSPLAQNARGKVVHGRGSFFGASFPILVAGMLANMFLSTHWFNQPWTSEDLFARKVSGV